MPFLKVTYSTIIAGIQHAVKHIQLSVAGEILLVELAFRSGLHMGQTRTCWQKVFDETDLGQLRHGHCAIAAVAVQDFCAATQDNELQTSWLLHKHDCWSCVQNLHVLSPVLRCPLAAESGSREAKEPAPL